MDENLGRGTRDRQPVDDSAGSAGGARPISADRLLSTVADEQRRAVLAELNGASEATLAFDALVDRVADAIADEPTERVPDDHRQRVRIALHHTHLPKLEAAHLVDYEADAGQVTLARGELDQELLTLVDSHDARE